MQVTVEVTAADIKSSVPVDACQCAIARAVNRHLKPECEFAMYGPTAQVRFSRPPMRAADIDMPKQAARWMERHDMSVQPHRSKPFSFPLDIPEQYLRAK